MANTFSLSLPNADEIRRQTEQKTKPAPARSEQISGASQEQARAFFELDMENAEQRKAVMDTIEGFGAEAVTRSVRKNDFLARRIVSFQSNSDETGAVARGLSELSVQMKSLDPSGLSLAKGKGARFFNPMRRYFVKYEKADSVIEDIIAAISNGERQLRNDNQTLFAEQEALEAETEKLNEYIALGREFDAALCAMIERARSEGADEKKIAFLESEVLFTLRQKLMDMGTLAAVNYQGIGTIEMIRRNNLELIRGVERAKQVSVCALRVGVMCAQALYNQKLVLKAVQTLGDSTAAIIAANAEMLGTQTDEIATLSASPMIALDTLKQSFESVFQVMDACEDYKRKALPQMAQAVEVFAQIAQTGEERVAKMQQTRKAS